MKEDLSARKDSDVRSIDSLSIIIPFYNEKDLLPETVRRCDRVLKRFGLEYEMILIDNCSSDGSSDWAYNLANSRKDISYVRFSRNFGPSVEASIEAGFERARGDAAVVVYSDLQDPPEIIPEMLAALRAGSDIAYGTRQSRRGDTPAFRFLSNTFYRMMTFLSESPTHGNSGDFVMVSRRVIDMLNSLPESARFFRGLVPWLGFRSSSIPYVREERKGGKSSTTFSSALGTAITGITSFSTKPLRLALILGIALAISSSVFLVIQLILWGAGAALPGFTTLISLGVLNLGVTTFLVSLVGEYVGIVLRETKHRPRFVVDYEVMATASLEK